MKNLKKMINYTIISNSLKYGVDFMANVKFYKENNLPLEMHKVRIVQKLN